MKDCDIKPLMYGLSMKDDVIHARLCLTESSSCKPDMLLTAWCGFAGCEAPRHLICREQLFGRDAAGELAPLENAVTMERTIYVQTGAQPTLAVTEDGRLCEYLPDAEWRSGLSETIFKGKVERVVPGMHAAFIRLGLDKNGFLPLEENSHTAVWPALQSGQDVLVQVKKEPAGQKGAFLTRDITLAGQYVPADAGQSLRGRFGPDHGGCGASRAARSWAGRLRRSASDWSCGPPQRKRRRRRFAQEVQELLERWEGLQAPFPTAASPSVLEKPRTTHGTSAGRLSTAGRYAPLRRTMRHWRKASEKHLPTVCEPTLQIAGACPDCKTNWNMRCARKVWLNSGANLFIDPCEAMTVIDVNSAKFTGKRVLEDTILRLNLEAAVEIARQIRLRNLSGIILVDFVDMDCEPHRQQVMQMMKEALAAGPGQDGGARLHQPRPDGNHP